MRRKLQRALAYTSIVLSCLSLLGYVGRDPLRDALGRLAAAWLSRALPGEITVGGVRGSLMSSLVLQDVHWRDEQGTTVARIAEVRLRYTLLALWRKRLLVHAVDLYKPYAVLHQHPDGSWNLDALWPTTSPALSPAIERQRFPVTLEVTRFQIHDGALAVQTTALPGVQRLESIHVRLHGQAEAQRFALHVEHGTVKAQPANVVLHTLQGAVLGDGDSLRLEAFRFQTDQTLVTGNGVLPGGTQAASLALHLQPLETAEVGRILQREEFYGPLSLALSVVGPPQALALQGQLQASQGQIGVQGTVNTQVQPWRYQGQLTVSQVNLGALLHREDWQSHLNFQLEIEGAGLSVPTFQGKVHFAAHTSQLGALTLSPSQVLLTAERGRLQVQHCDVRTSFAHLTAAGTLDMAGDSALQYALTADLAGLHALFGVAALDGTVRIQGEAQGERSALRAQGTLEAQHLRYDEVRVAALTLHYEGTPLHTQPAALAQLTAQQVSVGQRVVEQVTVDALYDQTVQQLHVTTAVRQSASAEGTLRGTLHWSATHIQLLLQEGLLQLADRVWRLDAPVEMVRDAQGIRLGRLVLTHADERFELGGTVDSAAQQDVRAQLTQLDLTLWQRLVGLPEWVQGRASLRAHLTGTAAAPRVEVNLTVRPETPRSAPFEQIRATFVYAEQQLRGDLQVSQAKRELLTIEVHLPVNLAFTSVSLRQRLLPHPVALHLQVKQPDLTTLSRWQSAWSGLSGVLEAELTVQGTYAALALEADIRLRQFGLQGSLQQVNAPMQLQATLALPALTAHSRPAAPSDPALLQIRRAVLRLPLLRGHYLGQDQKVQAFQVQHLVLQAAGWWTAAGFEGALESLQAQAHMAGLARTELTLAGRLSPQQIELTRLHLRWPQSELQGRGTLGWRDRQLHLQLASPRLHLNEVGVQLPARLPAFVRGTLEVRGSIAAPHVEAQLHYAGGQLMTTLSVSLQEPVPRYRATLRLDDLDAAALVPGAQGTLRASLQVQGTGFSALQRQATLELRLETSQLSLAPGLAMQLKGTLSGPVVRLEDFQLRSTPVSILAHGVLSTSPGDKTSMTYDVTLGDLTPLQQYCGIPLQAWGKLSGTLQGTWPALQARSRLQVREWTYATLRGQRVHADFLLSQYPKAPQATMKAHIADLRSPTLAASSLDLQGTYNTPQGTVHIQVTSGPYQKTRLEGRFTLAAEQRLTLTQLHIQHHGTAWDNTTPLTAVRSTEGRIDVQRFLLRNGRQELSGQGILTPDGLLEAHVQMHHIQLLPHVRLLAPEVGSLDGQLSLQLALEGPMTQPLVEGRLSMTALRWQQRDIGEVHGHFSTVGTTGQLEVRWQERGRTWLRVSGTIGREVPHQLNLQVVASEADLRVLQVLSTAVTQSSGRLDLNVHLGGTLKQPLLEGTLSLRDGTLQLAATGTRYTKLQGSMVFAGSRVDLVRLQAESGPGTLEVTGWATYTGLLLQHMECVIRAQNFMAMYTPDLEALVSATVTVRGSPEDLSAAGTITLPRVRAQLGGKLMGGPEAVQAEQLTVERVYGAGSQGTSLQDAAPEPLQRPPLAFLRANLELNLPQNVWVRGSGTAIELQGALAITKELAKPFALGGSVETVRGFASFYSGKFTVEQGHIEFTGSPDINPILDVVATREVSGYVVSVHVTGKAKTPQLHLSSTPELQQADIVTLLVLGKTTDRLTASERSDLSSQAQQIMGNVAASELEQLLAKPLGFDSIDIQTGANLESSKVSVGRYITQNLFLSYEQQLGEESGNKVGIEYSVNRHLKLKGSSTNKGAAALDLLWRIDY